MWLNVPASLPTSSSYSTDTRRERSLVKMMSFIAAATRVMGLPM